MPAYKSLKEEFYSLFLEDCQMNSSFFLFFLILKILCWYEIELCFHQKKIVLTTVEGEDQ